MSVIRIPYSADQANSFIDSCLYGMSYGLEYGEREYIARVIKELGHTCEYTHAMDDEAMDHVITLKDQK